MINEKESMRVSRLLSLVLRHQPGTLGIELDENGWTNVQQLIAKINATGIKLELADLANIVATNDKKRFAFDASCEHIRASQGHSVEVNLDYTPKEPPLLLYHGTAQKNLAQIRLTGLQKRKRQHVHLSTNYETAIKVGSRHGVPVVLEVLAGQMFADGFLFYFSENGVWLTSDVPVQYLGNIAQLD